MDFCGKNTQLIIKKVGKNRLFFFGQTFISLIEKRWYETNQKQQKNKFAIPALFDPKTTNQFWSKCTNYYVKISLENKLSVELSKLKEIIKF